MFCHKPILIASILCLLTSPALAQTGGKNLDPDKARLVTTDIDNFWRAYDLAKSATTTGARQEIYQREYFDRATPGLQFFKAAKIGSLEQFVTTIERRPRYYASLRPLSLTVATFQGKVRKSLRKLKKLLPGATFPDIYFVIGRMSSAGTASEKGLMIGIDMFGRVDGMDTTELSDWHKQVLARMEDLPGIVAHELIHFQQTHRFSSHSLLELSIAEGACDFLGDMISGQMINRHLHLYGNPQEEVLWREFESEMDDKEMSNWLYNGSNAKGRPADLGYYMGYKICEAYYQNARDKKQAIQDILKIQDFHQFLTQSRYAEKFARRDSRRSQ